MFLISTVDNISCDIFHCDSTIMIVIGRMELRSLEFYSNYKLFVVVLCDN